MTRRSITTSHAVLTCDVCGRTLLRGENADPFIAGGSRRMVCELCTGRAANEGWIREGADDIGVRSTGGGGRRSLLGRLRRQGGDAEVVRERVKRPVRERAERPRQDDGEAGWGQETGWDPGHSGRHDAWPERSDPGFAGWEDPAAASPDGEVAPGPPLADDLPPPDQHHLIEAGDAAAHEPGPESPLPSAEPGEAPRQRRRRRRGGSDPEPPREQRHVHAVPTNAGLKVARALEIFNASGNPRTVAGVARSLGEPIVAAHPSASEGSIVVIVVAWELCWYRYEIDLADEATGVRVVAQGAELEELEPREREANAEADGRGSLTLTGRE